MTSGNVKLLRDLRRQAAKAADLMAALAHEGRLVVLCALAMGERSAGSLGSEVELSQSALSQHLARLREGGFVATRREGQTVIYRLADEKAARVVQLLHEMYCSNSKGRPL